MGLNLKKAPLASSIMILGFAVFGITQELPSDLRKDIEELKQNQQMIIKELQAIRSLLSSLPMRPAEVDIRGMEIDLLGKPVIGKGSSNLVMIEFSDYQCPYCGQYARETFPKIRELYVNGNKMDYVMVDMPLPSHKLAPKAAEAVRRADEQGKFWEMHEQLMAKQDMLDKPSFYAANLNLSLPKFEECLNSGKYAGKIKSDIEMAGKLGMKAVPGFILAARDPQNPSKAKGIIALRGAMPLEMFQKEIDQALACISK
jgi:protein-disulfide isomerase